MAVAAGTGNTASTNNLFDNITVDAVSTVNLLGVKDSGAILNQSAESVSIYPNPAKDFITIDAKEAITNVYVYDAAGRRTELEVKNNKVNVSQLTTGSYLVGIKTNTGYVTKKLIKE